MNSLSLLSRSAELPQAGLTYCYSVYGLRIRTPIPLTIPAIPAESTCDIEVLAGDPLVFEESLRDLALNSDWAQAHRLPEGWFYGRFKGMFDFLVSPDGCRIYYRPLGQFSTASFEAYLLGLLMKAVVIKRGEQSLHASSVIVDGKAVAFLGASGFGKSSLAASFVSVAFPLLTDDVLRLEEDGRGFWAYPGPARLKLLPDEARQCLDGACAGVPMDPMADKWLFPVSAELQCHRGAPLAAIYCLIGPAKAREAKHIAIEALEPREALPEILRGIHVDRVVEPHRITPRFDAAGRIASAVPVRRLTYPRVLALLPDVRNAILADIRGLRVA